jgi:dihydrofolate reductase
MTPHQSRITLHMAASLDGYIARAEGDVDWMETSAEFAAGETLDPAWVEAFLQGIDCYVMGARTYETALDFERQGLGWAYGNKPVYVLSHRELPSSRTTVHFRQGDLAELLHTLRARYRAIWCVGGATLAGECLRRGLVDELRYSILPVLIGAGIAFFDRLDKDVALQLTEVRAYKSGTVALRYDVLARPA